MPEVEGRYVLFVCEGSAEQYILNTLIERNELIVPRDKIVRNQSTGEWYLSREEANKRLNEYLSIDYGGQPLLIIRIVDSDRDMLKTLKPIIRVCTSIAANP